MVRVVLFFFLVVSAAGFAETLEMKAPSPYRFNVSNHSMFLSTKNLVDDGSSPSLVRSETHVRAETDNLSLSTIMANRVAVGPQDGANVPFVLEKKALTFENDRWQVILGDSHQELGHGIALALYRDDTLGFDNSLEGASAKYTPDDWEFKWMAGRAKTLAAPVNLIPFQSPLVGRDEWLASTSIKRKWSDVQLGAHYLLTMNKPYGQDFDKRWHTVGGTLNADQFIKSWDFYGESNVMVNQYLGPPTLAGTGSLPNAYGSFASLIYSPAPYKIKLEARDYRQYAYDFRRPPTLEEDVVTSLNFQDITTARLWAERRLGVYNMLRASLQAGQDRTYNAGLAHAVIAGRFEAPRHVGIETRLGHRWLFGSQDIWHGDIKAKVPTRYGQSFEVGYRKLRTMIGLDADPSLNDRNYFDFAYTFSSHWGITLGAEYLPSNAVATGQIFGNASTLIKYDAFTGRIFVGSTSGGPQCSGGICRMIPQYSGFLLEGTYTF